MSGLSISKIQNITPSVVREVLGSSQITHAQKVQFMRNNSSKIKAAFSDITPTSKEYEVLMESRPLIKGKPIKNTLTKRGDKILLAKTLKIPVSEVDSYIKGVQESLKKVNNFTFLSPNTLDAIKTYIYRHGSAEQLGIFFDYELSKSKDTLKTLYRTLSYNNCGVADYFIRPIHRMKNSTLVDLYHVIDKNLTKASDSGQITQKQRLEAAEWSLIKIYQIQHNSKFINAIKIKQYE